MLKDLKDSFSKDSQFYREGHSAATYEIILFMASHNEFKLIRFLFPKEFLKYIVQLKTLSNVDQCPCTTEEPCWQRVYIDRLKIRI